VTVPHLLRDGDRIRVGTTELRFRTSAPAPPQPQPPPRFAATPAEPPPAAPIAPAGTPAPGSVRHCLEVTAGLGAGLAFSLEGTSITIGRDLGCTLRLDDLSISRRHCLLSEFGGHWHVSDLHSSRGTLRNGELLPPGQDVALNGCDCFGCCDVARADGTTATVLTSCTACTAEALDDPEACPPCQQGPGCYNPCEPCEYCIGKTVLPADCPDDGDQGCDPSQPKCSPSSPCPPDQYCLTGCCIPYPT